MHNVFLVLAAFLASTVEMVEAMTIILAVGITRGWRTALTGVVCASIALFVIVGALGTSLDQWVPIDDLRIVVGILLLIFGMQWIRKAIMRSAGVKALHDEDKIFQDELKELEGMGTAPVAANAIDWNGFVVSFKGVFLEGLEVAFIVISFGANSGRLDLAAAGAIAAFVLVAGVGAAVHQPLSRVPENSIKFAVGVMLMSFGTFWGGEGIKLHWSLGDAMIPILALFYLACAIGLIALLKERRPVAAAAQGSSA
jgi:uncharacterized membrane protein